MLFFSQLHYLSDRWPIIFDRAFDLTLVSLQRLLLIYDPIELILVHLVQVVMHLDDRAVTNPGTVIAEWFEFIIIHIIDAFLDLPVDALLNHNVSKLVLALRLLELIFRRLHCDITLAHIVHLFPPDLADLALEGLLHGSPHVQVLVTPQERILDPEHQ